MIRCIAHNISSPLGWSSRENFSAILHGRSELKLHTCRWGIPEPFVASLFPDGAIERAFGVLERNGEQKELTQFEKIAILSITAALKEADSRGEMPNLKDGRTLLLLSTTKANVSLLEGCYDSIPKERINPGAAARVIAEWFGMSSEPIVVSNACTSGVSAQVAAMRLLESGRYDTAIVCGADLQNRFIVSGFQSFKALSPKPCKPFDTERDGLNLGEAAATMILTVRGDNAAAREGGAGSGCGVWQLEAGAIRNDANHISGPSRTAEGSYNALMQVIPQEREDIAFISLHGTATQYNDEMESIALRRAGLESIPAGSLKGWYGHTMGASGVLETIISMMALEEGMALPTRGYETNGVSTKLNIGREPRKCTGKSFIKLLSGFGGCNAAVRWHLAEGENCGEVPEMRYKPADIRLEEIGGIELGPGRVLPSMEGTPSLDEIYNSCIGGYPKFHKMDGLCKLGFVATELLKRSCKVELCRECSVVMTGYSGSLQSDTRHQERISNADNYYPSPAIFVYTLPNIVTGEICIRNGLFGESNFYLLERRNSNLERIILEQCALDNNIKMVIGGWLDYLSEDKYLADIKMYKIIRNK